MFKSNLLKTIDNMDKYNNNIQYIIVDQGNEGNKSLIDMLKDRVNIEWYELTYDIGLSAARNKGVDYSNTNKIIISQDSIILLPKILGSFKVVEDGYADIITHDVANMAKWTINPRQSFKYDYNNYTYCDAGLNLLVGMKNTFKLCRWNEELKLAEHFDFFNKCKRGGVIIANSDQDCGIKQQFPEDLDYNLLRKREFKYYLDGISNKIDGI
jgi:hypothetical protein